MITAITTALAYLRGRWAALRSDDTGATAIEWAIFALLAIAIAGTVAAAITIFVNNKSSNIK